jgi:hypothetical protein
MSTLLSTLTHVGSAYVAAGLVASCSSANEPVATSFSHLARIPIATATSDSGKLNIAVYTTPNQPPPVGVDGVEVVVTEATTGVPIEGLSFAVTPWMPAMGHGTCCTPVFADMGNGRYVSQQVSLYMPGEWQLRTQLSGTVEDSVAPTFDVP